MTQWPADQVERRKVAGLIPYARNSRTHSDAQVAQIAASIREFGFTNPILLDGESGIIAGHGRILAARLLGITDVPCMVATGWSEAQKRAYVLADNKLALNAGWDDAMLAVELGGLGELGFDLELTGFGLEEMALFFGVEAGLMPDMPSGDRDGASDGTITIRLSIDECEEVISYLDTIIPNKPSRAILEAARRGS